MQAKVIIQLINLKTIPKIAKFINKRDQFPNQFKKIFNMPPNQAANLNRDRHLPTQTLKKL